MKRFLLLALLVGSCSERSSVRSWGGKGQVQLATGRKLVNATWKGDSLWMLTRPMRPDEKPETYEFRESSAFGVWEGVMAIVERRE